MSARKRLLMSSFANSETIHAVMFWIVRYAVVDTQPLERASNTTDASRRDRPDPPCSSLTYAPPKPRPAHFLRASMGKCAFLSHSCMFGASSSAENRVAISWNSRAWSERPIDGATESSAYERDAVTT